MPVLVAYAGEHGSTQGIADRVAAILRASVPEVDLAAAEDAGEPAGYDAFVLGSAVYAVRWIGPTPGFIRHIRAVPTGRPVWLFSVGPVGQRIPLPATLPPALAGLEAWATGIASELHRTRPPHTPRSAGHDGSRPLVEGL